MIGLDLDDFYLVKETRFQNAVLIALRKYNAICREIELDAGLHGFLYGNEYQNLRRITHPYASIEYPLCLK